MPPKKPKSKSQARRYKVQEEQALKATVEDVVEFIPDPPSGKRSRPRK